MYSNIILKSSNVIVNQFLIIRQIVKKKKYFSVFASFSIISLHVYVYITDFVYYMFVKYDFLKVKYLYTKHFDFSSDWMNRNLDIIRSRTCISFIGV